MNKKIEIVNGKLIAYDKESKSVFTSGRLVSDGVTYKAYPCKNRHIQKILYQYCGDEEYEFLCKNGSFNNIEIQGIKNKEFIMCLEKARQASERMKEVETLAAHEFIKIFKKESEFKGSFNGMVSAHIMKYIDLENLTFSSFDEGRDSFKKYIEEARKQSSTAVLFFNGGALEEYLRNFLRRNFYWQYRARITPKFELGEVHMGQNGSSNGINNVKSLYISPRLRTGAGYGDGRWENYPALNLRVSYKPFSIGHLLNTGFILNNSIIPIDQRNDFINKIEDFYSGFNKELTLGEKKIVDKYLDYVNSKKERDFYESIPLLPQYRFGGLEINHKYRSDFLIIDAYNPVKSMFIEVDDPRHKGMYESDTRKRNELAAKYHFQQLIVLPEDNIESFFDQKIKVIFDD